MTTYIITSSDRNTSLPIRTACYTVTAMSGEKDHGQSANERLAWNLRVLREQAGMSQAALAAAMRERGKPWHQSTVARVESGKQPAGFEEAADLAAILGTRIDRFTWASREALAADFVTGIAQRAREQARAVADAVADLLAAVAAAERALKVHADSPYPSVREARGELAGQMGIYGVDGAVAEGRRRYEERREAGDPGEPR